MAKKKYTKKNFKGSKKTGQDDRFQEEAKGKGNREQNLSGNFCSGNDPTWYNRNTTLIHDAARIPWGYPTGLRYNLDDVNRQFEINPPAIMVLEAIPIPGLSKDSSSPINMAASGLYQYTRKHLSTTASYMMADQFMVNLAIDNIFTMWAHMSRLFGMAHLYAASNLNVNRNLVCAIYNWSDTQFNEFIENIAGYQARFNNLIFEAATLYMPTHYTITERHTWMFSNYFTDVESTRAQFYAYTPKLVYKLNETELDTGTALEPIELSGNRPFSWYLDKFQEMLDALRSSDLAQMVMADERRAYEDGSFYTLGYVSEDWILPPAYSKTALLQIHNTDIYGMNGFQGTGVGDYNLWVRQDVNHNTIVFNPTWIADHIMSAPEDQINDPTPSDLFRYLTGRRLLDCSWNSPTEDDILEMTRNLNTLSPYQGSKEYAKFDSLNCDIVTGITFFGPGWHNQSEYPTGLQCNLLSSNASAIATMVSNFDWAPLLWMSTPSSMYTTRHYNVLGDVNCFTLVDHGALQRLNNNVQLSMWSVPELGAYDGK